MCHSLVLCSVIYGPTYRVLRTSCAFEVPALVSPGGIANGNKGGSYNDDDDNDLGTMDFDDNDSKAGKPSRVFFQLSLTM